jgi:adenosine deaminase
MEDFIRLMPKCEMHLHIEASWAPPAVLQEFLDRLAAL